MSIDQLPNEVLVYIFSFLEAPDVEKCRGVCKHWQRVAESDEIWQQMMPQLDRSLIPPGTTIRSFVQTRTIRKLPHIFDRLHEFVNTIAQDVLGEFTCLCLRDKQARIDCAVGYGNLNNVTRKAVYVFVRRLKDAKKVTEHRESSDIENSVASLTCRNFLSQNVKSHERLLNILTNRVKRFLPPRVLHGRRLHFG